MKVAMVATWLSSIKSHTHESFTHITYNASKACKFWKRILFGAHGGKSPEVSQMNPRQKVLPNRWVHNTQPVLRNVFGRSSLWTFLYCHRQHKSAVRNIEHHDDADVAHGTGRIPRHGPREPDGEAVLWHIASVEFLVILTNIELDGLGSIKVTTDHFLVEKSLYGLNLGLGRHLKVDMQPFANVPRVHAAKQHAQWDIGRLIHGHVSNVGNLDLIHCHVVKVWIKDHQRQNHSVCSVKTSSWQDHVKTRPCQQIPESYLFPDTVPILRQVDQGLLKVNDTVQHVIQNVVSSKFFWEDDKNFLVFTFHLFVGAFLGVIAGSFLDNLTVKIQGTRDSRWQSLGFLALQIAFISVVFFIAIRFKVRPSFDSWLMETIVGYTFGVLFLAGQPTLATNSSNFIKF